MFKSKNLIKQLSRLSKAYPATFLKQQRELFTPLFSASRLNFALINNFSTGANEDINAKLKKNQEEIAVLYKQWRLKDAMGLVQENIKLKKSLYPDEAKFKESIVGELIDLGNLNFYNAEYTTSLSFYEEAYNLVTGEYEKSEILGNIALIHRNLNNYKVALDFYKNSSEHLSVLIRGEKAPPASALIKFAFNSISQAEIYGAMDDKEGYEKILKDSVLVLEREFPVVGQDDKNRLGVVDSMMNINEGLGEYYYETKKPDQGRAFFEKNIQLSEQHYGVQSLKYARALKNLAYIMFKTSESQESLPLILKAKELAAQLQSSREVVFLRVNLFHLEAQIYMAQSKFKEAAAIVEEFFKLKAQNNLNEKYLDAIFLNIKSDLLKQEGKLEEAYSLLEKWLENSEKEHISQSSVTVVAKLLENLSSLAHLLKNFDKSLEYADKGMKLLETHKMDKTSHYAYILRVKGLSLVQLKDYSAAVELLKKGLQIVLEERTHVGDMDKLFLEISYAYEKMEKKEEAIGYLEKAYQLRLKLFEGDPKNEFLTKLRKKIDDMKNATSSK